MFLGLKTVVTCGGKGTRLLPFSKELPKEMAPIFTSTKDRIEVKPLIQHIFENLFTNGIRDFCFVTGRTKRSIEDHFSPDMNSNIDGTYLDEFYTMLENSNVIWVNQSSPKGFGDAVYQSYSYIGTDSFILHAGDVSIIQSKQNPIKRLMAFENNHQIDAVILLKEISDPERHGIATVSNMKNDLLKVTKVVEKPDYPESNLGIMPLYMFRNSIFSALQKIKPGKNNELQLTDAIQKLIDDGKNVVALRVDDDIFLDVGTPKSFWEALNQSYNLISSPI